MSTISRMLGVHFNTNKGSYSGFGNLLRDVAIGAAGWYAAPLVAGAFGAGGAGAAAAGAGGAGAAGAGALTEFSAPEIAAMGGGLSTAGGLGTYGSLGALGGTSGGLGTMGSFGAAGSNLGTGAGAMESYSPAIMEATRGASSAPSWAKYAQMGAQAGGGQNQQQQQMRFSDPNIEAADRHQKVLELLTQLHQSQQGSYP